MNKHFDRIYVYSLYCIVGTLMLVNMVSLASGVYLSVIPLLFQSAVIFAVIEDKPWASKVVIAWSVVAIVGGIASLLAVSIGDAEASKRTYFHVASIVFGAFFAYFSKEVLSRRAQSI